MDVVIMIVCIAIVLSVLVFIHEGGHYLAARAFGVRVTEFMLGLPGPRVSFLARGTRFGVTAVPLGGYAKVCGMEVGPESPYLERVLAYAYERGTVVLEDVARDLGISGEDAEAALFELTEWGSLTAPHKKDKANIYRTPQFSTSELEGTPRPFEDAHELYLSEARQQYRALPFWKRSVILVAGPGVNLIFALMAFVLIYSVMGIDVVNNATGAVKHVTLPPLDAVAAGFRYIGMVIVAVAGLFNPATAAHTVSESTSLVGMAVMSKTAFEQGFTNALMFMSMISVSLGIMNLIPIPPLDGGRFAIEVVQKITGKNITMKIMSAITYIGLGLIILLFVVMLNQDIHRFILGS